MAFGGPPFAVAGCILLARVEVSTARRVVRGGESAGGPAPQGYGELDETTFITVMAFVGLGVVFCALAALSRRGASRLVRLDAQLAASRGVRDVEAGDFGGASSRSDPCAVGDIVSLIRRGVRVEGTGVVTRADARRDSYKVRWSRELSDTFTYLPVAGGPLLRARRRPGPKRGWRREDLLLATPPDADAGGGGGGSAPPPSDPIPSARALEGLWLGTWHQGSPSRSEALSSSKSKASLSDGGDQGYDFELVMKLVDETSTGDEAKSSVARLRSLPGADVRAFATVHLHTRRFAMELFKANTHKSVTAVTDDARSDPEAFLDGLVTVADEGKTIAVDGGWIGADGTFGAASLRLVGGGAQESSFETGSSSRRLLRTPSGARARFKALARAARAHGLAATLLSGSGVSLVVDDDDDVVAEETNDELTS